MVKENIGLLMALSILLIWATSITMLLFSDLSLSNPFVYVCMLVQMHLYTGLFITAHDAMHGTVSPNHPKINLIVGWICTLLYAAFPFYQLNAKHYQHHRFVHTKDDPDYHQGNFIIWYFNFIKQYLRWWQIAAMAIIFNVLKIWISEQNLLFFWVIPSLLSTLQLFYFGTYLPHRGEHQNIHQSKTQSKNHIWAFFSCYFFGYHFEHHDSPATPWWKLWQQKEKNLEL